MILIFAMPPPPTHPVPSTDMIIFYSPVTMIWCPLYGVQHHCHRRHLSVNFLEVTICKDPIHDILYGYTLGQNPTVVWNDYPTLLDNQNQNTHNQNQNAHNQNELIKYETSYMAYVCVSALIKCHIIYAGHYSLISDKISYWVYIMVDIWYLCFKMILNMVFANGSHST